MGRLQRLISLMILLLLSNILFAQGWQTTWDTGIIPNLAFSPSTDKITAYADKNGIHVLTTGLDGGNYTTKYYLFNSSGTLVRSTDHGTMVSAALTGSDNNIYIIYIDNASDRIKGKKSSDAGQSWSSILERDMEGTQDQEYLTTAADARGIHVSHDDDGGAYYRLYDPMLNSWTNLGFISSGVEPWAATSADRAHFAYDFGSVAYARSYNHVTQNFESEQIVETSNIDEPKSIIVDATKEYVFYSIFSEMVINLFERRRVINSSTWESEVLIAQHSLSGASPFLTSDGTVHIIYDNTGTEYRYISNGAWTTEEIISGTGTGDQVELTGIGNDLYALWIEDQTLRIRWKDEAPVAPKNVSVVDHPDGVLITWDPIVDILDLKEYRVYRNSAKIATVGKNVTSWVDCKVDGGSGPTTFNYRVKAMDNGNNLSAFSNVSSINSSWAACGFFKTAHTGSGNIPEVFALNQNIPNPFNPETTISIELPQASNVKVEIYNLRGELIQILTDKILSAGIHELTWNGTDEIGNLSPSGLYIYRINAVDLVTGESFQAARKMTLLR